jgi:dihydropteroate synthase
VSGEPSVEVPRRRRPWVVGVVNVTPDSFSDGGEHGDPAAAVEHAKRLAAEGADVLDVGGESTRPGSAPVEEGMERARVVPTIEGIRRAGIALPVSIDTKKASVADAALAAGATMVNDVSAGTADPAMLATAARRGAGVVLMHMRGNPATMQKDPVYGDVVAEVLAHLLARAEAARAAGVPPRRIWIDPGLGFGKTYAHNEALLRALERFTKTPWPVLVGASRKGFLGAITGKGPKDRLAASLACAARAFEAGAHAVRVHDVAETVDLFATLERVSPAAASPSAAGRSPAG